ncbi:MAG TPA: CsgG/HfaB family protein [Burkholderiaceae bacterium]|jgi:curli biogenesis system outer membrane secretion channel CsgG|nr:CsgG/HfaB family protein [Burkholderiaceae bacterium]
MRRIARTPALVSALSLAAGAAQADQASNVEKCSHKLGVMAVAEPHGGWGYLSAYQLGSPEQLLRMMVQQSGCFDVVERGIAMQNIQQERSLAESGELRGESNVGKGQMQAADFVMTPAVQIAANNTGGVGGALAGGLLNKFGLGGVAGGLKFKEASTSLVVADVRSSIQVASAEGKASKTDFDIGGWGWTGTALGAANGYTNTPEGKVIAASLLDNWNHIVVAIRDNPSLIKTHSESGDVNAANSTRAGVPVKAGEVLVARIANVKVYAGPSRDSKVVATLTRSDELIASGDQRNGFVQVDSANFSGWVQRTLVGPAR